ncbi:hypothetical protein jhhlp_002683 [Lomentospora prolificans]|uniref:Uncharacterized protein n=1 Tax=Lomentospora prolificans TaxID=41688 RepID=A0A2N3NES0_9PEZI|nr:hypothetical protein jhhlp_002683 [Lomentospora prolificans]
MPDINTLPGSSTHSRVASRRSSTNPMPPPPIPTSPSVNVLPSNQMAVGTGGGTGQIPSPLPSSQMFHPTPAPPTVPVAGIEAASGPGPLRHPRPLTAAELHQQLEREQEAVVNRLTRELALLRAAQNASVASNASSTSASATGVDIPTPSDTHLLSGAGYAFPTPRHHRTESNTSARSGAAAALLSTSADARRGPPDLSRHSSASHRSRTSSPGPSAQNVHVGDGSLNYLQQQRVPHASVTGSSVVATPGSTGLTEPYSPGLMPATARYEETAFYRSELETAKRENELLKRRIRELERMVRERRTSDAGTRPRSESASTTASVSVPGVGVGVGIAGPREGGRPTERDRGASITGSVGVGVPEDEVKVGESAASAGLR